MSDAWYNLLYSFELREPGQVRSVRALGREFAVWRDNDGLVHVFGAYCPHLGANLAIGGTVEDNCLKCPFHGWRFSPDGSAKDAPGCNGAPPGKAERYLSMEKNEMILVWLEAKRDAQRRGRNTVENDSVEVALWDIPEAPLLKLGYQFVGLVEHQLCAHISEIPENGADGAHLSTVHAPFVISSLSGWMDHVWDFTWTPQEPPSGHTAVVSMKLGLSALGKLRESFMVRVHVTQVGPAIVQEELTLPFGLGVIYFASSATPIKPLVLRYTHVMWCSTSLPRFVAKLLLAGLEVQVNRDVPIWNNKTYRSRPPYTKADSNIPPFRRWFKQFYSEHSETHEQAMNFERDTHALNW
jgi:cholesterol 7-desaturase